MSSRKTLKDLMDHWQGNAPGFDALRLIFALSIMVWHAFMICNGLPSKDSDRILGHPAVKPFLLAILPSFFFLGGFLVTGSALRLKKLKPFLIFRVFRIAPALMVEVTLSAIVFGAVVTTLPLTQYYTDHRFIAYFLNALGDVHFFLPGVFLDHPSHIVNVNLWTLPPDFCGYGIMSALIATGVIFHRKLYLGVFAVASLIVAALLPTVLDWGMHKEVVSQALFIYSFFLGALAHHYAHLIPMRRCLTLAAFAGLLFFECKFTTILGVFSACYLTLCIGFSDLRKFPLVRRGDYSYGVYLYGFPIAQMIWNFVPQVREWWLLYLCSVPVTMLFAMFSWTFIEKPILGLRHKFGKTREQK